MLPVKCQDGKDKRFTLHPNSTLLHLKELYVNPTYFKASAGINSSFLSSASDFIPLFLPSSSVAGVGSNPAPSANLSNDGFKH